MGSLENQLLVNFDECQAVTRLAFDWADSYDTKDWERLRKIIAPTLSIDYTLVSNKKWEKMPADEYIAMMSDPGFLGDPLLKTQHLLGAMWFEKTADDFIVGHHQLRAGHLRFSPDRTVEEKRGHSHATNELYYRKIEGVWKFAGLKPDVRWNEYEFETIFSGFICPRV